MQLYILYIFALISRFCSQEKVQIHSLPWWQPQARLQRSACAVFSLSSFELTACCSKAASFTYFVRFHVSCVRALIGWSEPQEKRSRVSGWAGASADPGGDEEEDSSPHWQQLDPPAQHLYHPQGAHQRGGSEKVRLMVTPHPGETFYVCKLFKPLNIILQSLLVLVRVFECFITSEFCSITSYIVSLVNP